MSDADTVARLTRNGTRVLWSKRFGQVSIAIVFLTIRAGGFAYLCAVVHARWARARGALVVGLHGALGARHAALPACAIDLARGAELAAAAVSRRLVSRLATAAGAAVGGVVIARTKSATRFVNVGLETESTTLAALLVRARHTLIVTPVALLPLLVGHHP